MKPIYYTIGLLLILSCRPGQAVDPAAPNPANPLSEFSVDGIGRIPINTTNKTIEVLLPSGFNRDSLRISYQLGQPLQGGSGTPATGSVVYFRGRAPLKLCLRPTTSTSGQCETIYTINIRYTDPLTVEPVLPTLERTIDAAVVGYSVQFLITNQGTVKPEDRQFRLRFRNQQTGFQYESLYWSFEGQSQASNKPNGPGKTRLNVTGTFPQQMSAGQYDVTLIASTRPDPKFEGRTEQQYAVKQPFVLKAGQPLLVNPEQAKIAVANTVSQRTRNLTPAAVASIQLINDFNQTRTVQGQFVSDTLLRFRIPANFAPGTYVTETILEGGKPVRSLVAIPSATASNFFEYVGALGNFSKTYSIYSDLPAFKPGDFLEVRYNFIDPTVPTGGILLENRSQSYSATKVMLVSLSDPNVVYPLQIGNKFEISFNVPFYPAWKLGIPTTVPKGEYQLVFQDAQGNNSLPHYRKITVL